MNLSVASTLPGIEKQNAGTGEMSGVSRDQMEPVPEGRSGDQAIGSRNHYAGALRGCSDFAPDVTGVEVNTENAVSVKPFEREKPFEKGFFALTLAKQVDAFGQFASGYDAEKQILAVEGFDRFANLALSLWMAQLGEHAGIEQHFHNSMSRDREGSRERSTP